MNAKPYRLAVTVVFLCLAVPGFAQTTPPSAGKGIAADGSGPADGAIKGGSIAPGETAGVPDDRAKSRCADLSGTLREQCLAQEEKGASSGGTRLPDLDIAKPPPTREAPPPQNPPQDPRS